jgi:hypothetical protein
MHGAVADKKMIVQPESSIAAPFIDAKDVGGLHSKAKAN